MEIVRITADAAEHGRVHWRGLVSMKDRRNRWWRSRCSHDHRKLHTATACARKLAASYAAELLPGVEPQHHHRSGDWSVWAVEA